MFRFEFPLKNAAQGTPGDPMGPLGEVKHVKILLVYLAAVWVRLFGTIVGGGQRLATTLRLGAGSLGFDLYSF